MECSKLQEGGTLNILAVKVESKSNGTAFEVTATDFHVIAKEFVARDQLKTGMYIEFANQAVRFYSKNSPRNELTL